MEILRWKTRLSVIWVVMAVGYTAGWLLMFMMPGIMEQMMVGEMPAGKPLSEGRMAIYALFWLIPIVMAVLCLSLKDSPNRWLNFVLGIIFGVFFIYEIASRSIEGDEVSIAIWLIFIAAIIFSALVAWFAWKWPKQEV